MQRTNRDDLVILVQVLPELVGKLIEVVLVDGDVLAVPRQSWGWALPFCCVGADEVALTGNGLGVIEGIALHAGGVALVRIFKMDSL